MKKLFLAISAALLLGVGSLFSQEHTFHGSPPLVITADGDTIHLSIVSKEVQVAEDTFGYPRDLGQQDSPEVTKELSQDSLISLMRDAVSLLAGLSTTPKISNFNENNVQFTYEDSLLTEEVVKVLSEALHSAQQTNIDVTDKVSSEIGARLDEWQETLVRVKKRKAKAYFVWPILIVLSLVPLILGAISERKLLQYVGVTTLVASLIGLAIYLPELLALSAY